MNPQYAEAYVGRAYVKAALNDLDGKKACEDLKQAFDMGINQAEVLIKQNCK